MVSFLNDGVDDVVCGCLTVGFAGVFLVIYVFILLVFKCRRDKLVSPVYDQMFNMGLTDCIQLLVHLIGGISSLLQFDFPPDINKILGGITNSAWFAWIIFSFTVAFNRLIAFCYQRHYSLFYSKQLLRTKIIICWFVMAIMLAINLSPYCTIQYNRFTFSWRYDSTWGSTVISKVELVFVTTFLSCSGVSYIFIFLKIVSMRENSTTLKKQRHEVRILIQAAGVCFYTILSQLHWQFYTLYMPYTRYSNFSSNLAWLLNSGVTPILCLTLNRTVQRACLQFLHVTTSKSSMVVAVVPTILSARKPL